MVHVFGIRHHGPGSARRLLSALEALEPDILLVEAPADAENLLDSTLWHELIPPVAMLLYDKNDLSKASYYPFAEFSPEWQAIKFALSRNIPVRFMDLPQGITFAKKAEDNKKVAILKAKQKIKKPLPKYVTDPLTYLAELAGYSDSERWWEATFEEQFENVEIFPALLDLMTGLREASQNHTSPHTLLREAWMRKTIRAAIKGGAERIAVVCGAWHAPTLHHFDRYKITDDNRLLKGLKKIKINSTWIPWTYSRLATQRGYGAGVTAPAWYQLLFRAPEEAVLHWMSKLARLFREEDMDGSPAHAIEAVNLAETLAAVSGQSIAGIAELRAAAIAVFCSGDEAQLKLVEDKMIIGETMGKVPAGIPKLPLQADLEKSIRSVRFGKIWMVASTQEKTLDLRKPTQLRASQLLHRMLILNISWGQLTKIAKGSNAGAFSETWELEWQPECLLKIIEAGMWGNTVAVAAANKVRHEMKTLTALSDLTQLIESVFNADLPGVLTELLEKISDISVNIYDVSQLMDALTPLVNAMRYGSTRGLNTQSLSLLIDQFIPRITIALAGECINLDDAATALMFKRINATNRNLFIINDPAMINLWLTVLLTIQQNDQTSPLLQGATTRILFDKEILSIEQVDNWLHYTLSGGQSREHAAAALEGFCYGSGLLLIHNPRLWQIIDDWINSIPMEVFMELLPLLRRTFAVFSDPERRKMMELAKGGLSKTTVVTTTEDQLEADRVKIVMGTVRRLLG